MKEKEQTKRRERGRPALPPEKKLTRFTVKVQPFQEKALRDLDRPVSTSLRQAAYLFLLLKRSPPGAAADRLEKRFFDLLLDVAERGGAFESEEFEDFWKRPDFILDIADASAPTLLRNLSRNALSVAQFIEEKGTEIREAMEEGLEGDWKEVPWDRLLMSTDYFRPLELVVLASHIGSLLKNWARAWKSMRVQKLSVKYAEDEEKK